VNALEGVVSCKYTPVSMNPTTYATSRSTSVLSSVFPKQKEPAGIEALAQEVCRQQEGGNMHIENPKPPQKPQNQTTRNARGVRKRRDGAVSWRVRGREQQPRRDCEEVQSDSRVVTTLSIGN
jgi:hypothetical protein